MASILAEIRTEYLPHKGLRRYRYANPFRYTVPNDK
jgi:hypothetical protein